MKHREKGRKRRNKGSEGEIEFGLGREEEMMCSKGLREEV